MRTGIPCLACVLGVALLPAVSATPLDFDVLVEADGSVTFLAGDAPLIATVDARPDESAEWSLAIDSEAARGRIVFRGFWNVSSPRQALPRIDAHHLGLFYSSDPADIVNASAEDDFVNVSGSETEPVFLFSIRSGERRLTFEKDLEPPSFVVGPVQELTPISFLIRTETNEPALANLEVRPLGATEAVPYPTPEPAFRQTFPVIALRENTTYEYWFTFWDFSGNEARSEAFRVSTPPKPFVAPPTLVSHFPLNGSVLGAPPHAITAVVESPNGAIPSHGVRLFFDLKEVTENITFDGVNVTYPLPAPPEAGFHRAGLEVRDDAGGFLSFRWSFTVAAAKRAPGLEAAALVLLFPALAATESARRRGR